MNEIVTQRSAISSTCYIAGQTVRVKKKKGQREHAFLAKVLSTDGEWVRVEKSGGWKYWMHQRQVEAAQQ